MWPEIAAGLLLLLLLQSVVLIRVWRSLRKMHVERDILVSSSMSPQSEARFVRPQRLDKRSTKVEPPSPQPPYGVSYDLARKLAREGANIEQLTSRCGLAHDEAALLLQLHRRAS